MNSFAQNLKMEQLKIDHRELAHEERRPMDPRSPSPPLLECPEATEAQKAAARPHAFLRQAKGEGAVFLRQAKRELSSMQTGSFHDETGCNFDRTGCNVFVQICVAPFANLPALFSQYQHENDNESFIGSER